MPAPGMHGGTFKTVEACQRDYLLKLLRDIQEDLNMRADKGVVAVGASIWNRICIALGNAL